MIGFAEARAVAQAHIGEMQTPAVPSLVLMDEETIERPYGWVFVYQNRAFVETGEFRYMLGGNSPFIVARETGAITQLGTRLPVEQSLREYEAAWNARQGESAGS